MKIGKIQKPTKSRWTNKEVESLKRLIAENKFSCWKAIQTELNRLHGVNRHENSAWDKWHRINIGADWKDCDLKFLPKRVDFILACWGNNFPYSKIQQGFKEQFGRTIQRKEIDAIVLAFSFEGKQLKTKEMKNMNNKNKKNDKMTTTRGRWTPKEDKIIGKCATANHAISQGDSLKGRSISSIRQRFYNLKKIQKAANSQLTQAVGKSKKKVLKTKTVKPIKKVKKTYAPRWTEEEDFDLVCNFYELSIDEARIRFNRTYSVIASRLEKIIDSTQAGHQNLLMSASKVIKARKQAEAKPTKVGLLKRRKARKLAKKTARSDKKMAKLEKKLNKMRGE